MFPDMARIAQFSFRYAGKESAKLLPTWLTVSHGEDTATGRLTHTVYTDPAGGLAVSVHARTFSNSPAIDWVLELENMGASDTPLIEDILPLDASAPAPSAERVRLHHANGSQCRMDDFLPQTTDLAPRSQTTLAPQGGRSSNGVLPFMNIQVWPSDFHDEYGLAFGLNLHVGDQCITAGLARWAPLFGGGVWNFTPYGTRGQIIGGFTFGFHIEHRDFADPDSADRLPSHDILARGKTLLDDDFPLAAARAAIAEWKSIRPFFLGDFYTLLPITASLHDWCAWQFHRDDQQAGVAMFLRRHRSPFPSMQVALKRVQADAYYEVSLSSGYEEAPRRRMSGQELTQLNIAIEDKPGSILLRYRQA